VSLLSVSEALELLHQALDLDVTDLGGVSNSRSAAIFGRTSSCAPGRLWDSRCGRSCDVLGVDRSTGLLWLRYSLPTPGCALEVGVRPSLASSGRWEAL
jgi:hypothetical protein